MFVVGILGFLLGFYNSSRTGFTDTCLSGKDASGGVLSSTSILIVVSIGVGIMVVGLLRILFEKPLNKVYTLVYFIIFY